VNTIKKNLDTLTHRKDQEKMKKLAFVYITVIILSTVFSIKIADAIPKYSSEHQVKAVLKDRFQNQDINNEKSK
jgi:hypothetical protein